MDSLLWTCLTQSGSHRCAYISPRSRQRTIKCCALEVLCHSSLSNKVCNFFFWWLAISMTLLIVSVEVILLIRVYAVYDRNKRILYGLAGFFLLTLTTTVILWVFYREPELGLPPVYGITGCYAPTTSNLWGLSFVPAILNEIILCLFMLYKAWITYKNDYGSWLLKLLVQDSLLYFSSIFVVLLLNCLVFSFAPRNLVEIGLGWSYAVPCTMGSRLLLGMLQQASHVSISK
ncbi:hypothetical protein JB92DRAFT_3000764 [Gautieria morchelliformis]|nr:hypothetical protein JB92DRAFT_3000764 [Gautieria morchelliformis]